MLQVAIINVVRALKARGTAVAAAHTPNMHRISRCTGYFAECLSV